MTTFVRVARGWQWREVAALLEAAAHVVLRPTLTGLGERVPLANSDIELDLPLASHRLTAKAAKRSL